MARNQLPSTEGVSINRAPLCCGPNYPFWKAQMKIFMEYVNRGIWSAIVNGYTILTHVVDNKTVEKPYESLS